MRIKQVVVLAGSHQVANSILPGLEQLGLQICDHFSVECNGSESMILCDPGFECTPYGSALIRQALNNGCPVLLDPSNTASIFEEIKQTGCLSEETRTDLNAFSLFRCLESDAKNLALLQANRNGMPHYVVKAFEKVQDLRYGENWHQKAALYQEEWGFGST